jgi:triacylglycerol lipase
MTMADKLPIVLAHGLCGFDEFRIFGVTIQYFKGIKKHLEECDYTVFVTKVRPTAGIKERAEELKEQILGFTKDKVHIIGHSMGGLDARYMISKLGMADKVATLVTIGTPHCGSEFADWGVRVLGEKLGLIWVLEKVFGIDTAGFRDLMTESCKRFNEEITNADSVRYISYAGVQKWHKINLVLQIPYWYIRYKAGANDGLVHIESAKWGEFKGIVAADHWNQIGWWIFPFGGQKKFDVKGFYEKIARTDLA